MLMHRFKYEVKLREQQQKSILNYPEKNGSILRLSEIFMSIVNYNSVHFVFPTIR